MLGKETAALKFIPLLWILMSSVAVANEGGDGGGGAAADGLALEPVTVGLNSGHYIQFKPYLKLKDAKDGELVKTYMPVIRYELIKSILGKDPVLVQTPEFVAEFAEGAAVAINKALGDDYVKEVLFEAWLIQ